MKPVINDSEPFQYSVAVQKHSFESTKQEKKTISKDKLANVVISSVSFRFLIVIHNIKLCSFVFDENRMIPKHLTFAKVGRLYP